MIKTIKALLNRASSEQSSVWGNALHESLGVTRQRYTDLLAHMEHAFTDKNYPGLITLLSAMHEAFADQLAHRDVINLLFRDEIFDTTIASRVSKPSLSDRHPEILAPFNGKKKIGKQMMDLNVDRDYPYIIEKMLFLTLADNVPLMISDPANALKHLQDAIEQNAKDIAMPIDRPQTRRSLIGKAVKRNAHPA
ncbi:MAG TPA: hypothetical protein VIN59_04665 [Alphaproteobacteria bacterium]